MAKKVTVTLVDDFDGSGAADETVEFGLDGVTYEIDLSTKNATKLRGLVFSFISYAVLFNGDLGRCAPEPTRHRKVRNPGRPTITVDGRYAVSTAVSDGEGEQVATDVRTIYRPCPQGRRPGSGRGQDAQPQLHRHRAHSFRPDP